MTTPKSRNELSDNPKSRKRQHELSENVVGARIQQALGDRTTSWLASEAGLPVSTVSDAVKRGPSRSEVAVAIARTLGVSLDWLLTGADDQHASRDLEPTPVLTEVKAAGAVGFDEMREMVFGDHPLKPLPLYGSAQGGEMGEEGDFALTELDLSEVLDYLRRPAALADDEDSYALTIVGESMKPRFKPGERVGVSPRARIEIGDDVIVQLRGENSNRVRRVLIKELVRRNATHIILAQHNPKRELQIERTDVLAMHKVKGHFL